MPTPDAPAHTSPPPAAGELVALWFGELDAGGLPSEACRQRWFVRDPAFDDHLRERFGALVEEAIAGELDAPWRETPPGRVASMLLLDQLPRNLHRNSPRAFAGDATALELARAFATEGLDRLHRPIERVFLYLPFEHSEALEDQQRAVELFETLRDEVSESARALFENYADYARRHCECIERFGRFPHRNEILGRESSDDERRYLAEGGGFG